MWKGAVIVVVLVALVSWYLRKDELGEVPELPNTYWGPGKPVPDPKEIRPFKINVPSEVIADLNRRLDNARELVPPLEDAKFTYGFPSTYLKTVVDYWRHKYNWSQRQSLLNKYPQFMTTVQGLDIHFYHIKPQLPSDRNIRVLPMLMLHGWPGSVVEFQKLIPLLTTPKPDKNFVFELIVPSLPGYGFSKPAVRPGLGSVQMAVVFKNLMLKLGYQKFYTQGGDWGSMITTMIGVLYPKHVIGAHLNMCAGSLSGLTALYIFIGSYIPSLVVENEHASRMYPFTDKFNHLIEESGYMHIQATKPDTVGTALSDSPVGLAAYILEKFSTWTNPAYKFREDGGLLEKYTLDELLDNLMMYWVTNSITTSQRLYSEHFTKANRDAGYDKLPLKVPSACAMFPHELLYQSQTILSSRYPKMIQMTHPPRGGHFAAFEEPELMATDIWSFVNKLEQTLFLEQVELKKKMEKKPSETS